MRAVLLARSIAALTFAPACCVFAAQPVILEGAKLVPEDGSPQGYFGYSSDIDGDVAVVGATDSSGMPEQGNPGAAYVFERQSNGTWRQVAKLLPLSEGTPGVDGSNFGTSVAVEGNVIVVGTYFSGQNAVFERIGGVWTRTANLNDTSGLVVDISNGTIISSSVQGADLYRKGATGWAKVQELRNGLPLADADYMGPAVAISSNYAIHGSYGGEDYEPGSPSGTAYIYQLGPNHTWNGGPVAAITRPGAGPGPDGFSTSVSIDGTTAVIYAFPTPYVFERSAQGVWAPTQTIDAAFSINGNTILGGGPFNTLRVHRRATSGVWTHQATLASSVVDTLDAPKGSGNRVIAGKYIFTVPSSLPANPPMIQENLEDGAANGWVAQPNSTFSVASVSGTRVYRQTNTVSGATAIYQNANWDRQSIQADVTPRAYASGAGDRWFGLVARYTDANNYYYITVRNSNIIDLKRMQNGVFQTLASAPLQVVLNRPYSLRLEAHAQQLRVFVEGRQVLKVNDSALTRGRPGVTMYRTQADYDNLILNPDPSRVIKDESFNTPTIQMDWDWVDYNYQWVKYPDRTVYSQPASGGGAYSVAGPSDGYSDQTIRARMRATQFVGADRWFGLIGRYVDSSNYYYVTLRSSNNISLRKLSNGAITVLDTATMPVAVNTWYNLRLDIIGNQLRAYVDGSMVLEATDTAPHGPGRYGVGAFRTVAEADDFLVVQP